MQCNDIRKKMDAWMNNEVPSYVSEEIERHLKQCPACRLESETVRQISLHMKVLPDIHAPERFARKTRYSFKKELVKPGLAEWWKGLSLSMRSAVCGVVLTGLLCGAILCNSITVKRADVSADPYQRIYKSIGIL